MNWLVAPVIGLSGAVGLAKLEAANIPIPNGSFESPSTTFVDTHIDSWQKAPKPDWYAEGGGYTWDQLTGVFMNTSLTSADHIDNCDGNQAMWMFAVPEVGVFQDYNSIDWAHTMPTHDFNAAFELGKSYHLTIGVIGGGGGMVPGASLEVSLYYRDAVSNMVRIAAVNITNSPAVFSNNTHLIDFRVDVPPVRPSDAWAGQKIGIHMLSTVSSNLEGGYWDLDNVRLSSVIEPMLANPVRTNGQFKFTLHGEPGLRFEILAATNLALPPASWTSLGTLTNLTGAATFSDVAANFNGRFYRARQVP
jgi:hypothetical protein